jgi:hypothetical protein
MKIKRQMIAIHWREEVRFKSLNIRYIGFRNPTSLLPPLLGEMRDEPLVSQLPGLLTLQNSDHNHPRNPGREFHFKCVGF